MFVPFKTTRREIQNLLAHNTTASPIDVAGRTSDVYTELSKIIFGRNGVVDGTALQDFWFPTQEKEYDVFISHSHNDLGYAVNLASWLERRCGLRCFVDHFVWKSADDLLKRIDDVYTWEPERNVYDYDKRNFSTSHVHTMLSMAILDIIDCSECCIFIESDQSISLEGIKTKTLSPWIYEELTYMKKGRITIPERYQHLSGQVRMYDLPVIVAYTGYGKIRSVDKDMLDRMPKSIYKEYTKCSGKLCHVAFAKDEVKKAIAKYSVVGNTYPASNVETI